ncbi:ATP-grasp domain-containing protein [Streptomyces sp. NPDC057638]|uniref:EamA family transporter n=1 Tax=Streptomyces sp. NPDC057638 TaxID=3346190 RepID=UPI0036BBAC79
MPNVSWGILPVVGYAFTTAVVNVYAGHLFQTLDPAAVAAFSFTFAGAASVVVARCTRAAVRPRVRGSDIIALNITTAAAWLTVLFALKHLEPAVTNVISLAIGPVFLALGGTLLRPGRRVLAVELAASGGIFLLITVLTWSSIAGQSAVGEIGTREAGIGIALAVVSGLASASNIVYSKRLSEAGFAPQDVMSVRFFLTIALSWAMVGAADAPRLADSLGPGVLLALISVFIPLYLLQVGVKYAEPITVSLLLCLGPGFTVVMQLFDRRLTVSLISTVCTLGITLLVGVGVVARHLTRRGSPPMRVAIVDAYSTSRGLPAALKEHGVECVHVHSPVPDLYLTFNAKGFVGSVDHHSDLTATAGALSRAGVGLVVAGTESGVALADQLSAALGTPGNGMNRPRARWDKYEMVQALRAAGVPHAATIVSSNVEEILLWARQEAHFPIVLKPVASAGTDNVLYCSDEAQARAAHLRITSRSDRYGRPNATVLAQEFLDGDEYFVNTVSRDGEHRTAEIWRYHKRRLPGGRIIFDHHVPVDPGDPRALAVERYTRQVLDALEIRNGAAHSEVMLTRRGPVLVECGARLGGGQVPEINVSCLGTSQLHMLALAAAKPREFLGLPPIAYEVLIRPRHVSLINPREEGVVPSAEAMTPVRALPSYAHEVLAHPAGHPVPRTIDVATSPGFVYLISDDQDQIAADYEELRRIEENGLYDGAKVWESIR